MSHDAVTIVGSYLSPYIRKVLVCLALKQIDYLIEPIAPVLGNDEFSRTRAPDRLPIFIDENVTLADSTVICEYLEEAYPQAPLYPANPADRARARWLEELGGSRVAELAAGIFFQRFMRPMVLKQEPDEELVAKIIDRQLPPLLDYLEAEVPARGFRFCAFMMADMSLMSPFVNAAYAGYAVDAQRWPIFTDFIARVKAHPVVSEVLAAEAATMGFS